ncbi:MAG: hypothetical protein O6703_07170 [Gammaproteobacteria bacterium]|nr:hypothetical protein [Gammaproteobacteria bacterium]
MSEKDIYTAPESELGNEPIDESKCKFFPTSQRKLVILFIATFGLYPVYWFYKNWVLHKKNVEKKIMPLLRAIFYIFFTHSLFRRVEDAAMRKGISISWSAGPLAAIFVILTIVSSILDRTAENSPTIGIVDYASLAIVFVLLGPIYMVQEVVNKINDDPQGRLNSSFSIYNFIFIIIGVLMWMLVGVGLFQLDIGFINQIYH